MKVGSACAPFVGQPASHAKAKQAVLLPGTSQVGEDSPLGRNGSRIGRRGQGVVAGAVAGAMAVLPIKFTAAYVDAAAGHAKAEAHEHSEPVASLLLVGPVTGIASASGAPDPDGGALEKPGAAEQSMKLVRQLWRRPSTAADGEVRVGCVKLERYPTKKVIECCPAVDQGFCANVRKHNKGNKDTGHVKNPWFVPMVFQPARHGSYLLCAPLRGGSLP